MTSTLMRSSPNLLVGRLSVNASLARVSSKITAGLRSQLSAGRQS